MMDINDIQKNVLERVRSGQIRPRPRLYFLARIFALALVSLVALALSAFVLSFIAFSIHESGEVFLLGFGTQGFATFLSLFPWALFAIDVLVIFALEWILQGFRFGYRLSLVNLFALVFAASALVAALVFVSPVHATLLARADRGELPFLGDTYEHIRDPHEDRGTFRGIVTAIGTDTVTMVHDDFDRDVDDTTYQVQLPPDHPPVHIGDHLFIFGEPGEEHVQAQGVGQLPPPR